MLYLFVVLGLVRRLGGSGLRFRFLFLVLFLFGVVEFSVTSGGLEGLAFGFFFRGFGFEVVDAMGG